MKVETNEVCFYDTLGPSGPSVSLLVSEESEFKKMNAFVLEPIHKSISPCDTYKVGQRSSGELT